MFFCCYQENACARCMLKACICCLWCLEKCLKYLNQVSEVQGIGNASWSRDSTCWPWACRIPMLSERLHRNSHQQHQFLHLCPWRFAHPGGKCLARVRHQHRGRLCALFGKGIANLRTRNTAHEQKTRNALNLYLNISGACSLLHSFCWRPGSKLSEGLHGVGPASPHRLTVCLSGGPLLLVCLWKRGRRSLPVLRCGHKVQWRQPWPGVLHGQSLNGERIYTKE